MSQIKLVQYCVDCPFVGPDGNRVCMMAEKPVTPYRLGFKPGTKFNPKDPNEDKAGLLIKVKADPPGWCPLRKGIVVVQFDTGERF